MKYTYHNRFTASNGIQVWATGPAEWDDIDAKEPKKPRQAICNHTPVLKKLIASGTPLGQAVKEYLEAINDNRLRKVPDDTEVLG